MFLNLLLGSFFLKKSIHKCTHILLHMNRTRICVLFWMYYFPLILLSLIQNIYVAFDNLYFTFTGPCIADIFAEYNQQDAKFHNFFISVRHSTCFRRFFLPSSGAQNCTYSVRYLSDRYCCLLLACGSSNGLTNTWRCMCSFELLMMDGKTVWNV
jgi:hypothetical protein